jgi:hypothetical protein
MENQAKQMQIEEENRIRVAELAYKDMEFNKLLYGKQEKKTKTKKKDKEIVASESNDEEENLGHHRQLYNE